LYRALGAADGGIAEADCCLCGAGRGETMIYTLAAVVALLLLGYLTLSLLKPEWFA
jgi:K+-transporting ATPase KdpF subunit